MPRRYQGVAALLAVGLCVSGCYGPFHLTRKVHHWNGQVSENKWVVEAVFLVCAWLPIYGVATAADALIINSVEFWTGKNMLEESKAPSLKGRDVMVSRVRGPGGEELLIEPLVPGNRSEPLHIRRQGDMTMALNGDGVALFSAYTLPNGTVVVSDASGQRVASYSKEHVEQVLASVSKSE